ncbi:hypothetical protein PBAC_33360 [Pedobacter glucosidilyticus]|nr:hypothetical protein [Pedobacter glucosidilyticus]KHJ36502.1 hypothetical protein PBAC_33360 [Pedobacter glucosidilyticus]
MSKILFQATIKLKSGDYVKGPVTTEDNEEYLFVNKYSSLDFYIIIKNNNGWYQSGGPSIQWPQEYIDALGRQVEEFLTNNKL